MNLNAYDNVTEKLDKTKTWVDIRKKKLFSRELSNRCYTCLMKRYDAKTSVVSFFIAMLDTPPTDMKYTYTKRDDYGRVKIDLSSIWHETYLSQLDGNCNVMIDLVESENDGEIYLLDV